MAATFQFWEDNGASPSGTTANRVESNWKNIDDSTSAYGSFPVVASTNSFDKWQYGNFTGAYNQLLNGIWAHTAQAAGTGVTIKGTPTMTADANRVAYATPSITTNANLSYDATAVTAIGSGKAVWFGWGNPGYSGKAASTGTNPAYTNYLTTQLQTTISALPGDTGTFTLTLRYDEN